MKRKKAQNLRVMFVRFFDCLVSFAFAVFTQTLLGFFKMLGALVSLGALIVKEAPCSISVSFATY